MNILSIFVAFLENMNFTVVFQLKQVPFSLLKLKVFDFSKILCNEFKNKKSLQLCYVGEFERRYLAEIEKLLYDLANVKCLKNL